MENKDEMENLIDIEDTTPYESYGILVWSVTTVVVLLSLENILELGDHYVASFIFVASTVAYAVELIITRKENSKYNIDKLTNNQVKRNWITFVSVIFAIPVILVFNKIGIIYYSYPFALFLISFSLFSSALFLNKFYFKQASIFGFIASFSMFGAFLYFGEDAFGNYEKYISAMIAGGVYLYITVMIEAFKDDNLETFKVNKTK